MVTVVITVRLVARTFLCTIFMLLTYLENIINTSQYKYSTFQFFFFFFFFFFFWHQTVNFFMFAPI